VREEAEALRMIGIEVDVMHIRGWISRLEYVKRTLDVLRLNVRQPSYDVVHAHYGHSAMLARLQFRAPLVITYYGGDLLGNGHVSESGSRTARTRIEAAIFRQLARVASATITQSREMEARLPASCWTRNFVVPSPVDLSRFRPGSRAEARANLGWSPDDEIVLFIGDPKLPVKGYPLAEEVCARIARDRPRLRLQVASGVPHESMPTWLNAADALLFPSRSEGSPNAVREAMAAALPVVSTPVGDVPERLAGVEGCFVTPPQPDELARALVAALDHGPAPQARDAVAPLDFEPTARRLREVYEFARHR